MNLVMSRSIEEACMLYSEEPNGFVKQNPPAAPERAALFRSETH